MAAYQKVKSIAVQGVIIALFLFLVKVLLASTINWKSFLLGVIWGIPVGIICFHKMLTETTQPETKTRNKQSRRIIVVAGTLTLIMIVYKILTALRIEATVILMGVFLSTSLALLASTVLYETRHHTTLSVERIDMKDRITLVVATAIMVSLLVFLLKL